MNYSLWGHKESDTTEVTWHTGMDVRAGPQTGFNVKKKKCFWAVVLEKTLEITLASKDIKLVNPKGNQP